MMNVTKALRADLTAARAKVGANAYQRDTGKRWCVTSVAPTWVTITSYASGVQFTLSREDFLADFTASPPR